MGNSVIKFNKLAFVFPFDNLASIFYESKLLSHETGGVIYGFKIKDNNEYIISGFTDSQPGDQFDYSTFCRKDKIHFDIINEIRKNDFSIMYFGDWHFHPSNNSSPSKTDTKTFSKICQEVTTSSKYLVFIVFCRIDCTIIIYSKALHREIHRERICFNN